MTARTGVLVIFWTMLLASISNSIIVWFTGNGWNLIGAATTFAAAIYALIWVQRMKSRSNSATGGEA